MANERTTSGSPLGSAGSSSLRDLSSSSALKPGEAAAEPGARSWSQRSGGGEGRGGPRSLGTGRPDKEPQLHPACADPLLSKALSDGFTSLPALLKDVKISNHRKVNISKLPLFRIHHIFKNPLNSISPFPPASSPPPHLLLSSDSSVFH